MFVYTNKGLGDQHVYNVYGLSWYNMDDVK